MNLRWEDVLSVKVCNCVIMCHRVSLFVSLKDDVALVILVGLSVHRHVMSDHLQNYNCVDLQNTSFCIGCSRVCVCTCVCLVALLCMLAVLGALVSCSCTSRPSLDWLCCGPPTWGHPGCKVSTVSRMKKSKSYAGQSPTEEDLVAAHVDAGKAPVQRVSHKPYGRVIHMSVFTCKSAGPACKEGGCVPLGPGISKLQIFVHHASCISHMQCLYAECTVFTSYYVLCILHSLYHFTCTAEGKVRRLFPAGPAKSVSTSADSGGRPEEGKLRPQTSYQRRWVASHGRWLNLWVGHGADPTPNHFHHSKWKEECCP